MKTHQKICNLKTSENKLTLKTFSYGLRKLLCIKNSCMRPQILEEPMQFIIPCIRVFCSFYCFLRVNIIINRQTKFLKFELT